MLKDKYANYFKRVKSSVSLILPTFIQRALLDMLKMLYMRLAHRLKALRSQMKVIII